MFYSWVRVYWIIDFDLVLKDMVMVFKIGSYVDYVGKKSNIYEDFRYVLRYIDI